MRHDECSETRLLLWLDGETSPAERAATSAHLQSCWLCRSRLAELERDLHRIADAVTACDVQCYPESRLEAARHRLRAAIAAERRTLPRPSLPLPRLWRLAWIPAAAVALTGGIAWVAGIPRQSPPPSPPPLVRHVLTESVLPPAPASTPARPLPPLSPPPGPARADLVRFALHVYETAHAMGLAVSRPMQLQIENHFVRISGLPMDEQENLRIALGLDDRTAEWFRGSAPAEPTGGTIAPPLVDGPAASLDLRIPLHSEVAAITGNEDSVKDFADRAVRLSELINRRAHALDELARTLPESDEALLDEQGRMRLSLLVIEHLRALERHSGELRLLLAPLAAPDVAPAGDAPGSWQEIAAQFRARFAPVHLSVLNLFTLQPGHVIDRAASLAALDDLWRLHATLAWHPRLRSRN